MRQRRITKSTYQNGARLPSYVRLRRTQTNQNWNVSNSQSTSYRRFNEDLQKNTSTNITFAIKLSMLAEALKSAILHFISLHLHLKEFVLNYALPSKQLCDHMKQNRHLLPSSKLMMISTNTASIGLTTHTEEVNVTEETREQDFSRRDAMSATSQAAGLLSIDGGVRERTNRS